MAKQPFDNLMKVMAEFDTDVSNSKESTELDFDLPRGYVAKIERVDFFAYWDDVPDGNFNISLQQALVRDPDDTTSVGVPDNTVDHDVICEGVHSFNSVTDQVNNTGSVGVNWQHITYLFDESLDVVTARNMRWNRVAQFSGGTISARIFVYYTLEKVTDSQIMELLDIL